MLASPNCVICDNSRSVSHAAHCVALNKTSRTTSRWLGNTERTLFVFRNPILRIDLSSSFRPCGPPLPSREPYRRSRRRKLFVRPVAVFFVVLRRRRVVARHRNIWILIVAAARAAKPEAVAIGVTHRVFRTRLLKTAVLHNSHVSQYHRPFPHISTAPSTFVSLDAC